MTLFSACAVDTKPSEEKSSSTGIVCKKKRENAKS